MVAMVPLLIGGVILVDGLMMRCRDFCTCKLCNWVFGVLRVVRWKIRKLFTENI